MSFVEETLRATARELYGADHAVVSLAELAELGWEELVAEEPVVAVSTLAEEQGRLRGSSRIVELEIARRLALDPAAEAVAFALGGPLTSSSADVVLVADAAGVPTVVVPVDDDGPVLCRVPRAELESVALEGIDSAAGWVRCAGSTDPAAGARVDAAVWAAALAAGRRALAHEILGVVQAMLDLAVVHVIDRHQFGVPLGTFQAVQHRLAEVHVQAEAARAISRTAWIDGDALLSAGTLAAAHNALDVAVEHCHQVMGALGCTWEHDLHRCIRRGLVLRLLLEPGEDLRAAALTSATSTMRTEVFA